MIPPKIKCFQHIASSLAALDAALDELQEAVVVANQNHARLGDALPQRICIKLNMIHSLLDQLETFQEDTETSHYDETNKFLKPPTEPWRN